MEQEYCYSTNYYRHTKLISHRFVEITESVKDAAENVIEAAKSAEIYQLWSMKNANQAEFLARTDFLPETLRQTHYAIYHDACKVGMWTEPFYDMFSGAIVYAKGTWKKHTRFIFWDSNKIMVKLERVFTKHPEKAAALETRFPNIFAQKNQHCAECKPTCKHRQGGDDPWCSYAEFWFINPSHENAVFVWELFKLENNIKLM